MKGCAAASVTTVLAFNPSKRTTLSLPLPSSFSFNSATTTIGVINTAASVQLFSKKKRYIERRCEQGLRFGCCLRPKSPSLNLKCDWEDYEDHDFIVVNFYHFVFIKDPEEEVSKHLAFVQGLDIHGRIYLNEQGINAQYSGPSKDALAYAKWLREDHRFHDAHALFQISPAIGGHAFPRLKLRYKPSLVQLEGGISHLPLLDPSMRATPLTPSQWRRRLEALNKSNEESTWSPNMSFILLDVRNVYVMLVKLHKDGNLYVMGTETRHSLFQAHLVLPNQQTKHIYVKATLCRSVCRHVRRMSIILCLHSTACGTSGGYEWDVGHFRGARRPDVDCFRTTPFKLSQSEVNGSDPLAGVDEEKTEVFMYCTGGIRCDVFSTILRQRGFKNLYTLKGGVSHYLQNEGPAEWVGNLFVFDSRLSLPPRVYKPEVLTEANGAQELSPNSSFASCYICGSRLSELRHRNCANLDCNFLFLCCTGCVDDLSGCCCLRCTNATRRRPVLPGHQRYKKWHYYRDVEAFDRSYQTSESM